jgi:uncharacterized protein
VKAKQLHAQGEKTWAVVFDTDDEVVHGLTGFAKAQGTKQYRTIPVDEQVEVVSLVGDIALRDGESSLHAHAVLGKADGSVVGGHLLQGHVRPTLEVVVVESPAHLQREHDPVSGLALIRL